MSRALTRLRDATGDPLLVRAGRNLVATPRAVELREKVSALVEEAEAALRPAAKLDFLRLERTFTIRTSDAFVESFGPALLARMAREAPGVRLRFVQKPDRESGPLRDGAVDLETGVVGDMTGPEVRAQALFRDRFVGALRRGHPLAQTKLTPARYAAAKHILVSRSGGRGGPVDEALKSLGLERGCADASARSAARSVRQTTPRARARRPCR